MRIAIRNHSKKIIAAWLGITLLAGCGNMRSCYFYCHDGTEVQRDYVFSRDECQNLAEDKVHLFLDGSSGPKQVNSALLALFAKCMHIKDWGVTAPKQETNQPVPVGQAQASASNRAGVGLAPGFTSTNVAPVNQQPMPQQQQFYPYPPAPSASPYTR